MTSARRIHFRIFAISLCLTVLLAAVSAIFAYSIKDRALSFEFLHKSRDTSVLAGDWNNDLSDDVIKSDRFTRQVFIQTSGRRKYDQIELDHLDRIAGLFDVTGNGKKELGISFLEPDKHVWLAIYDLDRNSFPANLAPMVVVDNFHYAHFHGVMVDEEYSGYREQEWCPQIQIRGQADFNEDGLDDLILTVDTGYELIPRGIWIYDGRSLRGDAPEPKILAFRRLEATGRVHVADFVYDPHRRPEILLATGSVDNWTAEAGQPERIPPEDWPLERNRIDNRFRIDDRERVYLFAVQQGSKELSEVHCWESSDEAGTSFGAVPGPRIDIGGRYIYVYSSGKKPDTGFHRIDKIDCSEGTFTTVATHRLAEDVGDIIASFGRDKTFRGLLISFKNGMVHILDENLDPVVGPRKPFGNLELRSQFIADVDADGREELIAKGGSFVHILSLPGLHPRGAVEFDRRDLRAIRHIAKDDAYSRLIIGVDPEQPQDVPSDRPQYVECYTYMLRPNYIGSIPGWSWPSLAFCSGMTLAAGLGLLLTRQKRKDVEIAQQIEQRRDALLETLRSVGHGKITTSTLNQIKMLLDHTSTDPDPAPELLDRLKELAASYRQIARPQLERIPPAARAAEIDETTIRFFSEAAGVLSRHFEDDGNSSPRNWIASAAPITAAIDEIAAMRRRMLEEVSGHYICNPMEIAERMLVAAAPETARRGIDLEPLSVRLAPGIRAFGKDADLVVVLEDLLSNSMHAMKNCNDKRIALFVDTCGDRITVDVTDSGPGIPDDLKNRIFERGFTTKQGGGGLGLAQASEMLDKFGGRIFVAATSQDRGTTMRIELRIM